jgi:hypothetical protein
VGFTNAGMSSQFCLVGPKRLLGVRQIGNDKSACVQLWAMWRTAASWDEP